MKHFGKKEQIGTNVYAEVFALMKKNGLNLIWPAMHEGGYEFSSRPENFELVAKCWENGVRDVWMVNAAVQDNFVRAVVEGVALKDGENVVEIIARDPGVVIDKVGVLPLTSRQRML